VQDKGAMRVCTGGAHERLACGQVRTGKQAASLHAADSSARRRPTLRNHTNRILVRHPRTRRTRMTKLSALKISLLAAAVLAWPVANADTMAKADYRASKTRIDAQYKADKARCASVAGNARDICREQAKGKQRVARAELEYAYTGKPRDRDKVLQARADSGYAVARERCDDLAGNPKDVCVKEAKAVRTKARAEAKMEKKVGDAEHDAAVTTRDADYRVATEKCDALAGDAKASCVANAKADFGKK
jgi:hypothetical protein